MDDCCRICLDSTSSELDPLVRRCGCTTGFFHDSCFVEWIRRRETLECEVCNQTFLDVAVETRNVRVFSVMGPAYACLATQGGFVMFLWTVSSALERMGGCAFQTNFTALGGDCDGPASYSFLANMVGIACAFSSMLFLSWGWAVCVKPRSMGLIVEATVRDIILTDRDQEENGEGEEVEEGDSEEGSSEESSGGTEITFEADSSESDSS